MGAPLDAWVKFGVLGVCVEAPLGAWTPESVFGGGRAPLGPIRGAWEGLGSTLGCPALIRGAWGWGGAPSGAWDGWVRFGALGEGVGSTLGCLGPVRGAGRVGEHPWVSGHQGSGLGCSGWGYLDTWVRFGVLALGGSTHGSPDAWVQFGVLGLGAAPMGPLTPGSSLGCWVWGGGIHGCPDACVLSQLPSHLATRPGASWGLSPVSPGARAGWGRLGGAMVLGGEWGEDRVPL